MSENTNTSGNSPLIYVVIGLVAVIGLLAGLLISKTTTPEPATLAAQYQQTTPPVEDPGTQPIPRPAQGGEEAHSDVRRILRNLAPARRREIMQKAINNIDSTGMERPRVLMEKRKQARRRMLELARADNLDTEAVRKALNDVHEINAELAQQGTELTLEVMQLMTVEERKAATKRRPLTRRERRQQRRQQRRDQD